MMNEYNKMIFNGKCPYTNVPCEDWNCANCPVEEAEREIVEKWQGYGVSITTLDKNNDKEE